MNRINRLFQKKEKNIVSVYFTAGYPELDNTEEIICELEKNGVHLIEIGMPFSDPVADGVVIQRSSEKALENGMTLNILFEQLKNIRERVSIPLILMGYFNPVLRFGVKEFCSKCKEIGIDGVILPDLPLNEYEEDYKEVFEQNNLRNILLITPQTSDARIRKIDTLTDGFIYMVSSSATTGMKTDVGDYQQEYFQRIESLKLESPRLTGFGISNKKTFDNACQYSSGAIIGSAFVNALAGEGQISQKVKAFIESIS
jgi:tryptophan synthase alpha chain